MTTPVEPFVVYCYRLTVDALQHWGFHLLSGHSGHETLYVYDDDKRTELVAVVLLPPPMQPDRYTVTVRVPKGDADIFMVTPKTIGKFREWLLDQCTGLAGSKHPAGEPTPPTSGDVETVLKELGL